jgi:hypothetical protein
MSGRKAASPPPPPLFFSFVLIVAPARILDPIIGRNRNDYAQMIRSTEYATDRHAHHKRSKRSRRTLIGWPAISYHNQVNSDLKYAYKSAS